MIKAIEYESGHYQGRYEKKVVSLSREKAMVLFHELFKKGSLWVSPTASYWILRIGV